MKILFIGDVVGRPGREAVVAMLPGLRSELEADFVVVNGENAAGGIGITSELARELLDCAGADVVTLGNHAWAKREVYTFLDQAPRVVRPANYPDAVPGQGWTMFQTTHGAVAVMALQGRVFMDPVDDPFRTADRVIEQIGDDARIVIVDFHAEATSEKQALGWYLDGRATLVVGTHTHVQTADERVLPKGTAYITDAGMSGPMDSVIGMSVESVMPKFTLSMPTRFEVARGGVEVCGVLVDVDEASGKARSICRIRKPAHSTASSRPGHGC